MLRPEYSSVFEGQGELKAFTPQFVILEKVILPWAEALPPSSGGLLDVGAGQGIDAKLLAERNIRVVAMEPSNVLTSNRYYENVVSGTAEDLPFRNNSFSGIYCKDAYVFLSPEVRQRLFAEVKRLLVPGGSFLVITQRSDALRIFYMPRNSVYPQKETLYTEENWQDEVDRLSENSKVFSVEHITLPDEIMQIAQSYGLTTQVIKNFGTESNFSLENRWTQNAGFIISLKKQHEIDSYST